MGTNDELLEIATTIGRRAGELIVRRHREGVQIAASKSAPEDIVTLADRESEALIRDALAAARPNDGFYGEESGAETGTSGLTWVVDPIDGTVNYAYGIPAYAVSIAVVEGEPDPATWRAIAGAVLNPAIGEEFTGAVGAGARLNGSALQVRSGVELPLALIGTGFSYSSTMRARQADVVRGLIEQVRDIRRIGSAALDLCSVAAGRLDAYYERSLNPWDHAAGALIAREAGAKVGGLDGAKESRELLIAAEPSLYGHLESALASLDVLAG